MTMETRRTITTNEEDNVFDQLVETLAVLVNQRSKSNIVSQFKCLNESTFNEAIDPAGIEMWIQEIEKAFRFPESNEE